MRPGFSGIRARDQLESNLGSHWQPTVDIDLESKRPKLDDATVEDPLLADPDLTAAEDAAEACRMDNAEMAAEELEAFPDIEDVEEYLAIRNRILQLWYSDCHQELLWPKVKPTLAEHQQAKGQRRRRILVLGAGMAGLTAARHLEYLGFEAVVVEARDRVGGRVHTYRQHEFIADLGAMVITGLAGNPLGVLAKQTRMEMHTIAAADCVLYDASGEEISRVVDLTLEQEWNRLLETAMEVGKSSGDVSERSLGEAVRALIAHKKAENLEARTRYFQEASRVQEDLCETLRLIEASQEKMLSLLDELAAETREDVTGCAERADTWHVCAPGTCTATSGEAIVTEQDDPVDSASTSANTSIYSLDQPDVVETIAEALHVVRETESGAGSTEPTSNDAVNGDRRCEGELVAGGPTGTAGPGTGAQEEAESSPSTAAALMRSVKELHARLTQLTAKRDELVAKRDTALDEAPDVYATEAMESILDWHHANLEFANATTLDTLSLRHWNQDDQYEFAGPHLTVRNGYSSLPKALCLGLDVRYNAQVDRVEYGSGPVKVTCRTTSGENDEGEAQRMTLEADAAIVAIPLGVLKEDAIAFSPGLPDVKREAMCRLGFGVLNKVVLCFHEAFWSETHLFGHCRDLEAETSGNLYMFWNFLPSTQQPTLIALSSGKAAVEMEELEDEDIVESALDVLRGIFGEDEVHQPLHSTVTRWRQDPYSRGSYSYVAVGATGDDYDVLANPVGKQGPGGASLYFAGEHTNRNYPATVHGALLSGLREAARIAGDMPAITDADTPWGAGLPVAEREARLDTKGQTEQAPEDGRTPMVLAKDESHVTSGDSPAAHAVDSVLPVATAPTPGVGSLATD